MDNPTPPTDLPENVDHIEEAEALELAREEGIEFVDTFTIQGVETEFDSREEAVVYAQTNDISEQLITQTRTKKVN